MQNRVQKVQKPMLETMTPDALELVAAQFRLIAEPARLRLLQELALAEHSVSELAAALETTQPNVSKHLKLLQEAGLVTRRQEKNSAYFSIADAIVYKLTDLAFQRIQERLEAQAQALGAERKRRRTPSAAGRARV